MRGKTHYVVSVRRPDGEIVSKTKSVPNWSKRWPWMRGPIARGMLALIESLTLGVGALSYSANEASDEDIEIGTKEMVITMIFGFALALGLFFALPVWLARFSHGYVDSLMPAGWGNTVALNIVEGGIRIAIFFLYLAIVSNLRDIKRVFEYHGAEHKTIHAFESGVEMIPENIETFSTQHMRCGTSFLLVVMVTSIFVFAFLGRPTSLLSRIALRFLVLPLVAGVSYEIIKFAGRHGDSKLVRIIMSPGLALQRLTTREPSRDQVEVALVSLNKLLVVESEGG